MKKGLTQVIRQQTSDGRFLKISIVEKQSDLGLCFNVRLLVLIEGVSFGYISKFQQTEDPSKIDISKCKQTVNTKHITQIKRVKDTISIKFYQVDKSNNKKISKSWALKFSTENLAQKWEEIFDQEKVKSQIKRSVSASKRNSSIKSPMKSDNSLVSKSKSDLKRQVSKELDQKNTRKKEVKQYTNPLYNSKQGEDSKSSSNISNNFLLTPLKDRVNPSRRLDFQSVKEDPEGQNISEKNRNDKKHAQYTQFEEQEKRRRKEEEQRQKREEEQRRRRKIEEEEDKMIRQRQKIERQKRQLENLQKKLQMERKQLYQEKKSKIYPKNETERKDITVINEDFFQKPVKPYEKNKQQKNVRSAESPKQKQNNSKPKLEGVNYFEIVNKLIQSNHDQSDYQKKQRIQEAHDYLFDLQRKNYGENREKIQKKPTFNNIKNTIPKEMGWTYKQIVAENEQTESILIQQFTEHCQQILEEVVCEMHLQERKKKFRPKHKQRQFYAYEVDDIEFKMAIVGLKQIYNENQPGERDKICENSSIKALLNQYRSLQSLHEVIKQLGSGKNKGKMIVKVPLSCICEYHGFVALFKTSSQFDNQGFSPSSTLQNKLEYNLLDISEATKVSIESFKAKGNCLILKLNQRFYQQLASEMAQSHLSFDFYMIQQVKVLMPPDVLYARRNRIMANPSQIYEGVLYLRQELLIKQMEPSETIVSTILSALKKNPNIKMGNHNRPSLASNDLGAAKLQQLSQNVLIPISKAVKALDDLELYYIDPQQFTNQLHDMGINMRYLGLIYEHASLPFTKKCIMAEIAARSCKNLFRKTIQDIHFEEQAKSKEEIPFVKFQQNTRQKIIDFFNCVLGNSIDTVTIWKLLSTHSVSYFNIPLYIDQVNKGIFLMSLVHHCGLMVQWQNVHIQQIFEMDQFFNEDNFIDIELKCKFYEPTLNEEERSLYDKIIEEDPEVFAEINRKYNLSRDQLPQKFRHRKYYPTVRKYLTNFIAPENLSNKVSYQHLQLYRYEGVPAKSDIQVRLMELKWNLRRKKKQRYLGICNNLMNLIGTFYGDYHPYLSQLYQIFAMYHRDNGEFEDSITFSKSSLVNMLQMCGPNHPKVGEGYYELALCCIKAGRTDKAIANLQKAKNIFEDNQKTDGISYASVMMKLGLLFLSEGKLKDSQNITKFSLQIFKRETNKKSQLIQTQTTFEDEKIECYEILARIYQISENSQLQKQLSENCEKQMYFVKTPINLEKVLKIILYPKLSCLNQSQASSYLDIIALMPLDVSADAYIKSFHMIVSRIQENSLLENLNSYLENIPTIQNYIGENGTLKHWKSLVKSYERETVNDFVSLTQELCYFLGEGFLTGSLRENL